LTVKAMIMAAGAGTRLEALTQKLPKPLIPISNIPVMELILKHLKRYGITDVIANTHYLAGLIQDAFSDNDLGINFNYVYENTLSGTAGGVKKCEHFFDNGETFVVISGDALTDINLERLIKIHKSKGAFATMAVKEIPRSEVYKFGVVVIDENDRIIEFQEKPSISEARSNLVNTGIYVFEKEIFNYIPANTFYDFAKNVFPAVMQNEEKLCALRINNYWNDVGTISQYRLSTNDVLTGKVQIDMPYPSSNCGWISQNSVVTPENILNGKSVVGCNTLIDNRARIYGNSVIGDNCTVKSNSLIRNSIVWDNVYIGKNCRVDGCIIADNVIIKDNCILTPGSVVPHGAVISDTKELLYKKRA